jgi:Guanosine polyphosphate pyrophosphohydrolases/synthetases
MPQMTERFVEAVKLAAYLHRTQTRKGGDVPYISHLLRVAGLVLEFDADEDTAIAAMLHDAVEDQGGLETASQVREHFGQRVEQLVMACSDSVTAVGQPKRPWRERKETMIARLGDLAPEARLIIGCDKLDNLRCTLSGYHKIGAKLWERFSGGRDGTLWYYRSMIDALYKAGNCPVFDELNDTFNRLERLVQEKEKNDEQ